MVLSTAPPSRLAQDYLVYDVRLTKRENIKIFIEENTTECNDAGLKLEISCPFAAAGDRFPDG